MLISVTLHPKKITVILFLIAIGLTVLSISGHALQYYFGHGHFTEFVRLFNISGEANMPTWFDSAMLLVCSILLAAIAHAKMSQGESFALHWWALSLIFLCISLDETAQIHEILIDPLRSLFRARGLFYFAWVIPFGVFLIIFILAYLRFLANLPTESRRLFLISGLVYTGGALGTEMVSGVVIDYYPDQTLIRGGVSTLEDFLQMMGEILFIYTLLTYMRVYEAVLKSS
jgi:hypothetical protein